MPRDKSSNLLGRREVLKLFPQTAACLSLMPSSLAVAGLGVPSDDAPQILASGPTSDRQTQLTANWIWEPIEVPARPERVVIAKAPAYRNLFSYFRKVVTLPSSVRECKALITADSRYRLYVNGGYVGRGPVRGSRIWQYYDEYDLASLLKQGNNVIAVLVHYYGENTGQYMLSRPGLVFQAQGRLSDGQSVTFESDETWAFLRSKAFLQDAPRINEALGFVEIYDARKAPPSWTVIDFDDSKWARAAIVSRDSNSSDMPQVLPAFPPENFIPRGIPMLTEQELLPNRVVQIGETQTLGLSEPLSPAHQMSREQIGPLANCGIADARSLTRGDGSACTVSTSKDGSAVIVLDFGRELSAYPRLELDGAAGGIVDVGVSESLMDGRVTPTRNGLHCNRYIMKEGPQTWEAFEWDGFRYMQISIRNCSGPVTLRKVAANFTSYPVGSRGSFECSDLLLNRIWETSRHTLQVCMQDAYEDCPNREQRQWVGDFYIESKVNYAIFGDIALAAKALRQVAESQRSDGLTAMYYPGDLDNEATLDIKDFVLYWVSAIWEYYIFTADTTILRELYPKLSAAIAWFVLRIGPNGLLRNITPWIFYDWAELDKSGESTIINVLFYKALLHTAEIAGVLGHKSDRLQYEALAASIKIGVNNRLWDQGRGVYVDARIGNRQSRRVSQQSNALCLLSDIASKEQHAAIVDYIFATERVKGWQGPSLPALITSPLHPLTRSEQNFDEETDVVQAQPFFLHWVNAALAHLGDYTRILAIIRNGFGGMIEAGATAIWETWSSDASECHGWSTTAAYDLVTYILGVRSTAAGASELAIEPNPADLEWARGSCPTVRGDVLVHWQNSPNRFEITGSVPDGASTSVLIPLRNDRWATGIQLAGHTSSSGDLVRSGWKIKREMKGTRIQLPRSGKFDIAASYS